MRREGRRVTEGGIHREIVDAGEFDPRLRLGIAHAQRQAAAALDYDETGFAVIKTDHRSRALGIRDQLGPASGGLAIDAECDAVFRLQPDLFCFIDRNQTELVRTDRETRAVGFARTDPGYSRLRQPMHPDQGQPAVGFGQACDAIRTPLHDFTVMFHFFGFFLGQLLRTRGLLATGQQQRGQNHGVCTHHLPLRNKRSNSDRLSCTQVGRPWLHCPERSVASMARNSAFISGTLKRRLARTDP